MAGRSDRLPVRSALPMLAVAFLLPFMLCVWQIVDAENAAKLLSPYLFSDAALFHYSAWFKATFAADSYVSEIIAFSPYESLLTAVIKLFGHSNLSPFLLNAVLSGLACALVAVTASQVFNNRAAYVSIALYSLCAPLLFFSGTTLKTTWVVFLIALVNCLFTRFLYTRRQGYLISGTLVVALAAVDRSHVLVIPAIMVLILLLSKFELSVRKHYLNGAVIVCLMLGGLYGASTLMFGAEPKYVSSVGLNIYLGHSAPDNFRLRVKGVKNHMIGHRVDARKVAEQARRTKLSQSEVSHYWVMRAVTYVQDHPAQYLRGQLQKLHHLFAKRSTAATGEQISLWRADRLPINTALVDFASVFALFVVGVWLLFARRAVNPATCYLLLGGFAYLFSLMITIVSERYRIGALIFMIPVGAYLCDELSRSWFTHRIKVVAVIAVLATSYWLMVTAPAKRADYVQQRQLAEQAKRFQDTQVFYQLRAQFDQGAPQASNCHSLVRALRKARFIWDVERVRRVCAAQS